MLGIFGSILKIGGMIFGDHLIAKWVGHWNFYWEKKASIEMKAKANAQLLDLQGHDDTLNNKLRDLRDGKPKRRE